MSWFDTVGFANLAKSALSSAQKRIDQALDIQDGSGSGFTLPTDTDSFFLSFGLHEGGSPKKKPDADRQGLPSSPKSAAPKSSGSSTSLWASRWGSFLEEGNAGTSQAASVDVPTTVAPVSVSPQPLAALFVEEKATAVVSQPVKSAADDAVVDSEPTTTAGERIGSDSPLVVDLPTYPSLDQSVESDGSTETLLGTSCSPEDAYEGAGPDRSEKDSSPPGWQPSGRESGEDVVIVREPEHSNSRKEFPHKKTSLEEVAIQVERDAECVTPADSRALEEAEVVPSELDGCFVGNEPVLCVSPPIQSLSPPPSETLHSKQEAELATDSVSAFVLPCSADCKESRAEPCVLSHVKGSPRNVEVTYGAERCAEVRHIRKASNESHSKEDSDAHSMGSVHSVETSSSASFVRISPEETEDSRKSASPSGDEAETATSSDIEIISPPNGDSNGDRYGTISSSARLWTAPPAGEKRAESPSVSGGSGDKLVAVEESQCDVEPSEVEKLRARTTELQEILDARERKVFLLSKEVTELNEANAALQSSLQRLEDVRAREMQDTSSLTQEFSQRLARLETRLADTARERDILKAKLDAVQQESSTKVSAVQMEKAIREKDEQIAELMSEGEKLSKHQLQQSTIIKKLRAKEKDMEATIKSLRDKLEDHGKELERLRKSMNAKDEQEKKHIDTIRQLTSTNQKQEKEIQTLAASHADATENLETTLAKLNSAYGEIAALRQANSECESRAEEATLSAKMAAGEELRRALEQTRAEAVAERASLMQRIEELQVALAMAEQRGERREDILRSSMDQLQQQLQEAESRNQEISQHISSATRPLLRQIENLQATIGVQSASWEKIEKSLTDRLNEAQTQAALLSERERSLQDKCTDLQARLAGLEAQNVALRNDKHATSAEAELLRERLRESEDYKRRESSFETVKLRLEQSLRSLRAEKEQVSDRLTAVQEELESERHKVLLLQDQLQEKRERHEEPSPLPSPTTSHYSSVSDTFNANVGEEFGVAAPYGGVASRTASLYESLRAAGGTTLLESLQSRLKMKEGEVGHLQAEIAQLERCRGSLSRELMSLSERQEAMEQELLQLRGVRQQHDELNQRYNTLLQMYGEKVEQTEELRLDLEDVKSMYKAQINELMAKQ